METAKYPGGWKRAISTRAAGGPSDLDRRYNRSYTLGMKTAISIPEPVFRSAEMLARRLKMSRSQLYTKAVADFVARHRKSQLTKQLNEVYSDLDESVDPGTLVLQLRSLPEEEW